MNPRHEPCLRPHFVRKIQTSRTRWWLSLGALALVAAACAPGDVGEEGEEAGEETEDDAEGLSVGFQLPFPCGQAWMGETRTGHSPQLAVDFNRPNDIDDTVVAAAGGTVTRVDNEGNDSYGRWIEIDHGGGYRTRYAHLSTQTVSVGQVVARGKKIGTVGSTGGSSGPHLHYEQRRNGVVQKPVFNGKTALFFGEKSYTSHNSCGGEADGVVGTVETSGANLKVRKSPNTNSEQVGTVADGAVVTIKCQKQGASVTGTFGTSKLWDFIGTGYIADAYVSTGSDGQVAPTCP
jgi:hypothetical protein